MTEQTAWRITTAVLFTVAATIGTGLRPEPIEIALVVWLFWLTCTASTREELRVLRRRVMHALGTLRRRHDAEILEMWLRDAPTPYVPEADWAPAELAQPELLTTRTVSSPLVVDPITEPIDMNPATVPDLKAAAAVAPLPVVDVEWEERKAQLDAEWRAEMNRIEAS